MHIRQHQVDLTKHQLYQVINKLKIKKNMLIKKTVVSGFKEMESFNLNLYFEIHDNRG
jgi:hypothetical protein